MNIENGYLELLKDILENGIVKKDRTGVGTVSVFGRQLRHKMQSGFPLLTTKKMYWNGIFRELMWFLSGNCSIKYLIENDCHIWDGDVYKAYRTNWSADKYPNDGAVIEPDTNKIIPHTLEQFLFRIKTDKSFEMRWGTIGRGYGYQWRKFGQIETLEETPKIISAGEDQILSLINQIITNPDSRRLVVSAWNPKEIGMTVLPPCHSGFQVYTKELSIKERMDYWFKNNKPNRDVCDSVDESPESEQCKYFDDVNVPKRAISLMWNQRSVDTFLGLPFNIASYALLLEIIGMLTNMVPDELVGNLGDTHIYLNHIEQVKKQLQRSPLQLPFIKFSTNVDITNLDNFLKTCNIADVELINYNYYPAIKADLNN